MPIIPHTSSLPKPTLIPVSSTSASDKLRSSLLESFRSNQVSVLSLGDLSGHVLEFSQDQHGSRFIQQKLETATTEEKSRLWEEVAGSQLSLMTDVFGNYVIQKFVEHGSEEQQRSIIVQAGEKEASEPGRDAAAASQPRTEQVPAAVDRQL